MTLTLSVDLTLLISLQASTLPWCMVGWVGFGVYRQGVRATVWADSSSPIVHGSLVSVCSELCGISAYFPSPHDILVVLAA